MEEDERWQMKLPRDYEASFPVNLVSGEDFDIGVDEFDLDFYVDTTDSTND